MPEPQHPPDEHAHTSRTHDSHDHDSHNHNAHDDHDHGEGITGWFSSRSVGHGHSHDHTELATDRAFLDNESGIRTVWLALAALAATTVLQFFIYAFSGSIALLADTIHNLGDGLNSIPLLIAFYLARRGATRRYNYGFARAEDVAGIFIVFSIAFSAGWIFWESFQKLIALEPIRKPLWVAAAAVVGFLGNEAVALLQIRKGRELGSAALVADGLHARTDGLTSLAVLIAVVGHWTGVPLLDPLVGLAIGVAILFITKDASISMWHRLMDAIEPEILSRAEQASAAADDRVQDVRRVRMRWIGHQLHAEVAIAVDPQMTTAESHHVAEHLRRALFEALPKLSEAVVHIEPAAADAADPHEHTRAYESPPKALPE